jgi:hypothetical protein
MYYIGYSQATKISPILPMNPFIYEESLPISQSKLLHVDMDKKENIHETFTNPL